jgi:hypothetical protein
MFKFLKSLLISACLLFAFTGVTLAGNLMIQGIDMPSWVNWEPLYISYTALEAEGNPVNVKGYIKKDGEGWQEIGTSDKLSETFKIERSYFPGDGLYKIYFKEVNSGQTTPEESFNVDFTAPSGVSEYRKERKDANVYKICWKNPDNDDFDRVIIFRSEKTNEGFSNIAEVSGSKNEEKCYENGTPDNKDYYYVIRAIDHAGNASSTVGDSEVTATTVLGANVTATPTPTTLGLPLAKVSPETTPASEEGQILGGESSQASESKPGLIQTLNNKVVRFGFWKVLGIIIIALGIVILLVSLIKKRR